MPKKRGLRLRGIGTFEKDLIGCFLIKERGRKIRRIFVANRADQETARIIINENIKDDSVIYTDEFDIYNFLRETDKYKHLSCNHSKKEYVREGGHVNGCEGFTAVIGVMMGVRRGVNKLNLQKYLDGCVFASMVKEIGNGKEMIEYIIRCFVTSFFIYKFFIVWRILSSATKCYIRAIYRWTRSKRFHRY